MILDTNALSAFIDGDRAVGEHLAAGHRHPAIPVIVLGEFRYGVAGSRHRAAYEAWLDAHLADFDVLSVTEATAVVYADLRVALKKAGHPMPANDAWISALALEHRLPVLTRDVHFDAVPGLRRVGW
ncbi:MAG: type II toxin-antitoxin system VapC family toxin [Acidobacteriota bacterium]|nr:type II toxin-antitoxin system VapC family toxin [Acidobacteriota bacterium]